MQEKLIIKVKLVKVSMVIEKAIEVLIKEVQRMHELRIVADSKKLEVELKEIHRKIKEEVQKLVNRIEQDAAVIEITIVQVQTGNEENYLGFV